MDYNESGFIEYGEFVAHLLPSKIYTKDNYLIQAFEFFDSNKDGKVDVADLIKFD